MLHLTGIRFQDFSNHRFDGRGIRHLLKALFFHDDIRRFTCFDHLFEYGLGNFSTNGFTVHQCQQSGKVVCRDWRIGNGFSFCLQGAQQRTENPVGNRFCLGKSFEACLKVGGQFMIRCKNACILLRQLQRFHKSFLFYIRQFGHAIRDVGKPWVVNNKWKQIGIGKIAVIVGFLLAAHGEGPALLFIPKTGLLDDHSAIQQNLFLAVDFVPDRFFHEPE